MTAKVEKTEIVALFNNELTEEGLKKLRLKYPPELYIDMTIDKDFKEARKTRTECNKLLEAIKRRRLGITSEIKTYADGLEAQVANIYAVVVDPFLIEDARRKKIAEEEKRMHDEMIEKQREKIAGILGFVRQCVDQDAEFIAGAIEAVDLIDVTAFHKDIIHEAISTKEQVTGELMQMRTSAIAFESTNAERVKLEAERAEMAKDREEIQAMKDQLAASIKENERIAKVAENREAQRVADEQVKVTGEWSEKTEDQPTEHRVEVEEPKKEEHNPAYTVDDSHEAIIRRGILINLLDIGVTEQIAKRVIIAIATNRIDHVKINYNYD
jgi:hypothetical protein